MLFRSIGGVSHGEDDRISIDLLTIHQLNASSFPLTQDLCHSNARPELHSAFDEQILSLLGNLRVEGQPQHMRQDLNDRHVLSKLVNLV